MSDTTEDLGTLDAAISRVKDALENDNPDADIREQLGRELAVLTDLRLKISGGPPAS
jgi:hypothetical protein